MVSAGSWSLETSDGASGVTCTRDVGIDVDAVRSSAVLCDGTRIASARFAAARSPARYSHRQSCGNISGNRWNARSWTVTTSR